MADITQEKTLQRSGSLFDQKDPEIGHKVDPVNDEVLADIAGAHFDDPNLDRSQLGDLEDDSPYPEVRSAVANTDDPDMPVNTLRAWILGIIWAILLPGLNQFFFFRYPAVTIGNLVAQLLSFPMGRFLAWVLPRRRIFGLELNPGHQQQYAGAGSRGGISRERFFIYVFIGGFFWYFLPGYLFTALSYFSWVCWIAPNNVKVNHMFGVIHGMGMSLFTFDWSQIAYIGSPLATPWWAEANVMAGFFFFFWFLTPVLYYTNTWYAQYMTISSRTSYDNTKHAYDVTRILNPDATLNMEAYKAYSPLFLSTTFALSYGLSFASITATITHAVLYFRKQIWTQARRSLSEQPDIHARLMSRYKQVPEWCRYKQVPEWWYALIFIPSLIFGIVSIEVWPTQMPVWAFFLALIIAFVYIIPIGMIQAITNQQVGLNVITELIIGYALPGRPVAMMLFKTWGYITMAQALQFTSDFKLGHYMKIPPRPMFTAQVVATVISGTVQLGVHAWMFTNISGMCTEDQPDGFICPSTEVFGTASIIWGVIGPALQFSKGQIYYGLSFFFLIGAIAPALAWLVSRRYPNSFVKYVNFPVIFNGTGLIPPASAINFVPWAIVGFIFQYVIRRRHFQWWVKYNYVLSAALDSGVAISIVVIFFCLQYPKNVLSAALDSGVAISIVVIFFCLQYPKNGTIGENSVLKWWGNTVYTNTADSHGTPLRVLAPGETFGPTSW
ncbi:hypothetical protein RSAG8_09882, partial [Rhizoctonia solani AG-8 WAC10335]